MNLITSVTSRKFVHACVLLVAGSFATSTRATDVVSVGLEDMAPLLRNDARMIVMGDSYSVSWFFRVPAACLRTWPIPRITAMEGGPKQYHDLIRALALCSPVDTIEAGNPLGYTVERQEPDPTFFALPTRSMREIHADENLELGFGNRLLEFRVQNYRFEPGVHGPFSRAGDNVRFRMLYRCPGDPALQLPVIDLQDYYGALTPIDLATNARGFLHLGDDPLEGRLPVPGHINATLPDVDLYNDLEELLRVRVATDPTLLGSNTYLEAAGGLYYHVDEQGQRLPGLYYSYLADDSWSYDGFCSNEAATHAFDKRFSRSQLVHWLDATTIDPMQPVIFTWYIAPETLDYDEARKTFERMIDEMDAAGSEIGLDDVRHLLVIPHMHYFSNGLGDGAAAHGYMLAQQEVAFELANERENVAAASIYAATDGILFDGNPDAIQWLQERGFEDFEFGSLQADLVNFPISGTLLDSVRVHPLGEEGAGFFATVLGDMLRQAGCPADLKPSGTIDVLDLLVVLERWNQDADPDLDGDGVVNIGDLLAVIDAWGDCWPVQSPFNSQP